VTLLISAFGVAGRFAGDLLTSALGWAGTLLFGRVPDSHRVLLLAMTAMSFLWLLALLGLAIPALASFLVATTPHPSAVDPWLGVALAAAAILLPVGVGLAGYLVPAEGRRELGPSVVAELLRGYVLAPVLGGLLVFLAAVGVGRKIRSWRHGWSDVHVAVVVDPRGYDELVADLVDALEFVELHVTVHDAPAVLTLPARVLTAVAGPNVRKLRPDRPVELRARDLRIGVYASDIAISGTTRRRTRARAAVLSRLTATWAHLTTTAEAQAIEDRLAKLAGARPAGQAGPRVRSALAEIDGELLDLEISSDEWDILFRERLQVERDLLLSPAATTLLPRSAPRCGASGAPRRRTAPRRQARSAAR
jgi:hypothetical protein